MTEEHFNLLKKDLVNHMIAQVYINRASRNEADGENGKIDCTLFLNSILLVS